MGNREEFTRKLSTEIEQAGRQRIRYSIGHYVLIILTIVAGGITTYLVATGFESKVILSLLAGFTTLTGTFEKTFAFGRAKSGFRKAKTQFEKLENELLKIDGNEIPDLYIDKLNEIMELEVELTDAN